MNRMCYSTPFRFHCVLAFRSSHCFFWFQLIGDILRIIQWHRKQNIEFKMIYSILHVVVSLNFLEHWSGLFLRFSDTSISFPSSFLFLSRNSRLWMMDNISNSIVIDSSNCLAFQEELLALPSDFWFSVFFLLLPVYAVMVSLDSG